MVIVRIRRLTRHCFVELEYLCPRGAIYRVALCKHWKTNCKVGANEPRPHISWWTKVPGMLNYAGDAGDLVIDTAGDRQCSVCVVVVRGGMGSGRGLASSPEYRNKYSVTKFVPTQHPTSLPVPIIYYAITVSTWYTTIVFSQLCVACVIGSL